MNKKFALHLSLFILILLFVFRALIQNMATDLRDWLDYPFVVWVFSHNIDKFLTLDLTNFFDTNILYPHQNTLLLAENLIAPSLLGLPFALFTKNIILNFNIVFLLTFLLNYISAYLLWNLIFKRQSIAFIGALLTAFSPLFHIELGHFQIVSFWPFLFSIYFLLKEDLKGGVRNLVFSGLFLAIQFLSSAYLAVFLIFTILTFYLANFVINKKSFVRIIKKPLIILAVFILVDAFVLKGYVETRALYDIKRTYSEAVTYSAHLSDYFFTNGIDSMLHKSGFMQKWNAFNKHSGAVFPGFLIASLLTLSLVKIKKSKKNLSLAVNIKKEHLFFFILMLAGFVFSFGPRASFNGAYAFIPLPYHLIWKYVPLIDSVRAPVRWSFLFYFGAIFFALEYLSRKASKKMLLVVFAVLLVEYIPVDLQTTSQNYIRERDYVLRDICKDKKKVVLEIPVTHLDAGGGLISGLNYISKTQLASTYHGCYLVNGYTGLDHPDLLELNEGLYQAMLNGDFDMFMKLARNSNADIVSVNEKNLLPENIEGFELISKKLDNEPGVKKLRENLYQINSISEKTY